MEITTKSAEETHEAGRKLASTLGAGDTLALSGEMGAGKTTFIQGIAQGLGINQRVNSPTFIIMREYSQNENGNAPNFYHVDLYRIEENAEKEVENLGLLDIINKRESIVVIEWAEKIDSSLPANVKRAEIEILPEGARKITIR